MDNTKSNNKAHLLLVLSISVIVIILSLLSTTKPVYAAIASGNCGNYARWELYSSGLLTIKSNDESIVSMPNYETKWTDGEWVSTAPWYYYMNSIKKVKIEQISNIGIGAFFDCRSLTSITIPDSVTSIGDSAFGHCSSLTSITIPDSVTSIGDSAFGHCSSLTSITIPEGVTSIGNRAFDGCSSLTSITILEGVTSIGYNAFDGCSSLTSITIPDSVTSIGNSAFSDCSSLTSITIPDSVTSIGNNAFYECTSLKSIYLVENSYADKYLFLYGKKKYVIKVDGHYVYNITKKATIKEDGQIEEKCVVCGEVLRKETISHPNTFTLSKSTYTYNGNAKKPDVTVKDTKGKSLVLNTDYTVSHASGRKYVGKYKVTVNMRGNYTGSKALYFTIKGNLSKAATKVTVSSIADKKYTGSAIKPEPTVKALGANGKKVTLIKGKDYKLSYSNNKSVGKASVKITGIGNYSGSKTVYFTIIPKGTALNKLTPISKGFKVTWKKQTKQITGYEIKYYTSSNTESTSTIVKVSKPDKTSLKVTELKAKKKYYVRIRTYKMVNGKKYCSAWSKKKYVTTKA